MRKWVLVIAILAIASNVVAADCIRVKRSLFGGWKYSTDGENFEGVGKSGLRMYLAGNSEALQHLDSYKSNHTTAMISGIAAGVLMVYFIIDAESNDNVWKDEYAFMLIGGGVLSIISGVSENSAVNHLMEAVRIHNCGIGTTSAPSGEIGSLAYTAPPNGIAVSYVLRF